MNQQSHDIQSNVEEKEETGIKGGKATGTGQQHEQTPSADTGKGVNTSKETDDDMEAGV